MSDLVRQIKKEMNTYCFSNSSESEKGVMQSQGHVHGAFADCRWGWSSKLI